GAEKKHAFAFDADAEIAAQVPDQPDPVGVVTEGIMKAHRVYRLRDPGALAYLLAKTKRLVLERQRDIEPPPPCGTPALYRLGKGVQRRFQPDVFDVLPRGAGEFGVDLRRFGVRDRVADDRVPVAHRPTQSRSCRPGRRTKFG